MKTFKLKDLTVLEANGNSFIYHQIDLFDGLTINREDEQNRWVLEAYTPKSHHPLFERLKASQEDLMVEARITDANNPPATFITSIIGLNDIGEDINVLFMGTVIDQRRQSVEQKLKALIDSGYQGDRLLEKIKETI